MGENHEGESDRESIGFIGHISGPAEAVIDFTKPVWMLEFDFGPGRDLAQLVVNADSEKAAIAAGVHQLEMRKVNAYAVVGIECSRMETLTDGS